ncbi:MAG: DUF4386 domain-containing protein [Gemmatimonadaceae bacterium]|nr:DUF4386 domain-containing protein [Gemmatimonadaceae bacterium]
MGTGEEIQRYARLAGIVGVLTVVAGGFGEVYVPDMMVATGDPHATAQRILGNETLFRWGFAGYLVEALCDATLTMLFWVLVRPVHRNLAMLMVVCRIISTCGFGASQVLYFGALTTLESGQAVLALQPAHPEALAYLLLEVAAFGGALFSTFYGAANICFGWLVYRSTYLPRVFGVGLAFTGVAFVAHTVLLVLAPAHASGLLLATAAVGFIPFLAWLLVKGVNEEAWRRVVGASDARIAGG